MKSRRKVVLGAMLVALAVLVLASGCYPLEPKMSYQGRLTNPQGTPLPGPHNVTFRLRGPMPGAGTPTPTAVWSESKTITADANGLFNTVLGDTTPLDVEDFSQRLFLEVEIEGETLSPRQQLLGAPYAFSLVPGAAVVGAITPAPTPKAVLNVYNAAGVGLGAEGNPAILASGSIRSTADSYLWIPGTQAVKNTNVTGLDIIYGASGTAYLRASSAGDYWVRIPIDVPGVLYGQNVTVEEVRIYYRVDTSADYIDETYLRKNTGAGTSDILASDLDNKDSTTATYYTLTPTANNVLDSSAGGLCLSFDLHFTGTDSAHDILIGGVRLRLGHHHLY